MAKKGVQLVDTEYLEQIRALRESGLEWKEIGVIVGRHGGTVSNTYKKWIGPPPRIKRVSKPGVNRTGKTLVVRKSGEILPSWNGHEHICCKSFLRRKHFPGCTNLAGTWTLPVAYLNNYRDYRAVRTNKYDVILDEPVHVGKSYAQYMLEK